jgi:hypothetical protein
MALITPKSYIEGDKQFIGQTAYDATTLPSNENRIVAYDAGGDFFYGSSIAVGSGRIVVGAFFDYSDGLWSGSAYVYDLDGNLIAKLIPYDGAYYDFYGASVAVGSGRIVVGSYQDDDSAGSVYVYDLDGNLLTKLTAYDRDVFDYYGYSVSVGNGRIVIGAQNDNDKGTDSGSAYVYDLDGNLITKLTAYDGAYNSYYGNSVAVGSGRIVIGAYQSDNISEGYTNCGAIYIYDLNGNLITKKYNNILQNNNNFGNQVVVGQGRIVVCGFNTFTIFDLNGNLKKPSTSLSTGSVAVGDGRLLLGDGISSVYVYDLDGNLLTTLNSVSGYGALIYGASISIGSGRIVIGSPEEDNDGDASNGAYAGAAYIYETPEQNHILDLEV